MKTFITLLAGLFFGFSAQAHSVSVAKATELSLHRIERLVILKKIEEAFQSKFLSLQMVVLSHSNETEPVFKSTVFQYPASDGTQKSVDIVMNGDGKALSYTVNAGGNAQGEPTWPDKDPVTLTENALHYVIDGSATKPDLVPYNDALSSLQITQGTNQAGEKVAVVDVRSSSVTPTLRIKILTTGDFYSAEFIQ